MFILTHFVDDLIDLLIPKEPRNDKFEEFAGFTVFPFEGLYPVWDGVGVGEQGYRVITMWG